MATPLAPPAKRPRTAMPPNLPQLNSTETPTTPPTPNITVTPTITQTPNITEINVGDFVSPNPLGGYHPEGGLVFDNAGAMIGYLEAFSNRSRYGIKKYLIKANPAAEAQYRSIFNRYALAFKTAFPIQQGGKRKTHKKKRKY